MADLTSDETDELACKEKVNAALTEFGCCVVTSIGTKQVVIDGVACFVQVPQVAIQKRKPLLYRAEADDSACQAVMQRRNGDLRGPQA